MQTESINTYFIPYNLSLHFTFPFAGLKIHAIPVQSLSERSLNKNSHFFQLYLIKHRHAPPL